VAIGVGGRPQGVAARGDQVWVTSYTDHSITRIDPRTSRRLGDPVAVALNPYAVAIGPDSVWVTCVGDDRVVRVRFKGRGA
jgi:streptogramin lyase